MNFASDIRRYAEHVGNDVENQTVATLFQLNDLVITRTPVDKGGARGAWIASTGSPSSGTGTPDTQGNRTISKANNVAMTAVGKVYYLTNNLKYIRVIEYGGFLEGDGEKVLSTGYSRLSPKGMVRVSIDEIKRSITGIFG